MKHPFRSGVSDRGIGVLLVAGGLALVLVGCGAPGVPTTGSAAASGSAAVLSSAPDPARSTAPDPARPTVPGPSGTALSGVVIEGAQQSCRNLQTEDDGRWTLSGVPAATLAIGARVTVTGTARPDLTSPCGRVFVVTSAR